MGADRALGKNPRREAPKTGYNLPEAMINLCAAVLIWLFGVLVFLPLADGIDPTRLSVLVSLIIFSALSLFLIKGLGELTNALGPVSEVLAEEWIHRRKARKGREGIRTRTRVVLEAAIIIAVYLLYSPLLARIHPSVNGIAAIIALLGILFVLLKKR